MTGVEKPWIVVSIGGAFVVSAYVMGFQSKLLWMRSKLLAFSMSRPMCSAVKTSAFNAGSSAQPTGTTDSTFPSKRELPVAKSVTSSPRRRMPSAMLNAICSHGPYPGGGVGHVMGASTATRSPCKACEPVEEFTGCCYPRTGRLLHGAPPTSHLMLVQAVALAAMFRCDAAHTGICAPAQMRDTLQPRWRLFTGNLNRSTPAYADGLVYVGSNNGNLYALDAASGHVRWQFHARGPVNSSAAVNGGVVYFADDRAQSGVS